MTGLAASQVVIDIVESLLALFLFQKPFDGGKMKAHIVLGLGCLIQRFLQAGHLGSLEVRQQADRLVFLPESEILRQAEQGVKNYVVDKAYAGNPKNAAEKAAAVKKRRGRGEIKADASKDD